jgi:hypothetical protein
MPDYPSAPHCLPSPVQTSQAKQKEFDMALKSTGANLADHWRMTADESNPAGELFASGSFAEADIVCETGTGSGKCGTVCTGSTIYHCC